MNEPIGNHEIDALLDRYRPDRYDRHDCQWRDPVVAVVAARIPIVRAQIVAAEKLVGDREAQATKSVNRLLRKVDQDRQWPLPDIAADLLPRPLSINNERVRLEAASAQDFRAWAISERRDAAREASARFSACDGAEWIAEQMEGESSNRFGDRYMAAASEQVAA